MTVAPVERFSDRAVFESVSKERLEAKISRYEATIAEIEQNLAAPDFYKGDSFEVKRNRDKYAEELRQARLRYELAVCTGLPGAIVDNV